MNDAILRTNKNFVIFVAKLFEALPLPEILDKGPSVKDVHTK